MIAGAELRARRTALGVSQYRFAALAGVTSARLSAWELGRSQWPESSLRAVADVLVDIEQRHAAGTLVAPRRRAGRVGAAAPPPPTCGSARQSAPPPAGAPTVLTAFSGCGGMAEGFRAAGFRVLGYIEKAAPARASFALNFPESVCVGTDVADLDFGSVPTADVLAGGPPCQGFSLAGKRDRGDPRNLLFRNLLELADVVRPRVLVMENVRLLLSMRDPSGRPVIDRVLEDMAEHGFDARVQIVNAHDHGVPQHRQRVVIVGVRGGPHPLFPAPTHGPGLLPPNTFRDATGDLAPLEAGQYSDDPMHWAVAHPAHVVRWLRDVPEGRSAHENADPRLRPPSGYNTTYKRLRWDEPSSTVGTTFGMISASRTVHPTHTRSLTVREAMRLQTFPDDYRLVGGWGAVRTMIGNAVPPQLSRAVAEHLRAWLDRP